MEKPPSSRHLESADIILSQESASPSHPAHDTADAHDAQRNKALNRLLDIRIIPLCCWLYLLNFLDRGNIGNAKVLNAETGDDMLSQTGMTAFDYSITLTLFSVAYAVFEIPSNWVMKHYVRPSVWLAFLLFAWGVVTIAFFAVQNYATVLAPRLLIGVFEAGFFPGIVYLITIWYSHNERAFRIALVIAFCNLAGAFGGSISYGIGHINGAARLQGFRWLFIIEGIITVLSVLPTLLILPDYPARAKFLTAEDRQLAEDRLKDRGGGYNREHASRHELIETFFNPRMLAHYCAYIANVTLQGSFTFFAPTIVTGLGYASVQAQLMTVPPWVVGFCIAITMSYTADRYDARGWHIAGLSIAGGVGWLTAGLLPSTAYAARYGCLCLAAAGAFPCAPSMTNWVTCNTPSLLTIPMAIAIHNSCAGIGQIIAQWIWKPAEASIGYPTGNFTCAGCSFFVAVVAIGLRLWYARMNKLGVTDARGTKRVWSY
ncbi:retrograde regulation protein 2 [Microdochium bolleyi]|uniref:Retrograde regulation protein 2 n=1 Tax=Microdochium bolleyi TaxID=196109 RepID=A0A136J8W5_9PEZI|nr:retrograde regulation protein 2 [Microdochium bolleyi]